MIHYKVHLSLIVFAFKIAAKIAVSFVGTCFFSKTRKFAENKINGIWRWWWYFYLLNYAYHHSGINMDAERTVISKIEHQTSEDNRFSGFNAHSLNTCVSNIIYEIANGRLPIVNYSVWNDFFKQPILGVSTEQMKQSEMCDGEKKALLTPWFIPWSKTSTKVFSKLFSEYVHFNEETEKYVLDECAELLTGKKVLGCLFRGTDYLNHKHPRHPKPLNMNACITKIQKEFMKYKYDAIYLATEDKRIYDRFEAAFPGKILVNKRNYFDSQISSDKDERVTSVHFDRENDEYLKGLEYLSSLYIASKCDSFIGGPCSGTTLVIILNNNKFNKLKVFDNGLY